MSGCNLIEMLKRVGYPGAEKLDPLSLDWAFENPSTASFMQWVCSIGKENVLSQQEIEEYENLKAAEKMLAGSVSSRDSVDEDEEEEDDECQLQADVDRLKDEKRKLLEGKQQLDSKLAELRQKQSRVESLISKAKKSYDDTLVTTNSYSNKIDRALQKITESVNQITKLYTPVPERGTRLGAVGKTDSEAVKFLSQVDLSRFHQAEEQFSHDLTIYTKKRFFEGMADIAGTSESDQFSLLDVSHPENILVDSDCDKESFLEDCREFALLQEIFPKSELNRLNALVNTKKGIQAVQEAKSILHLLKSEKFPTSSSKLSHLQSRSEDHVRQAQAEATSFQEAVPNLVKELGTLQGTEILTGNYELKLKRQDYFTKNQDRVIEYLEDQRSRSELLLMCFDLELRFHERTHHLLCAAEKLLESHLQDWKKRMKCLEDPDLSRDKFERSVVDSRDTSCNSIYQMMGSGAKGEDCDLYLPLTKVKDKASTLYSKYENSLASEQRGETALTQNMSLLEDHVKEGKDSLYAESSTWTELPNLTPADVLASMVALQGSITTLTSNIDRAVKDIKQKKKILKSNPALVKEREMYSIFHTKPERLVSTIADLEEKLKISVSASSNGAGV